MKLLKRLRKRLTALNALISGAILFAIVLGALLFTLAQFTAGAENAFAHTADTIAHQMQSDTLIRHDYLRSTELSQSMLLYMEDGGSPFKWNGSYQSETPRDTLIERAVALAAENGLDISYPPVSSRNFLAQIKGDYADAYRVSVWTLPVGQSWSAVVILMDMEEEKQTQLSITLVFALCLLAGIAMQALFSYYFAGRAIRPVEKAQEEQAAFFQAASHELRTPLTVMRASADALPKADAEESATFAAVIRKNAVHMARLVDDMLTLADGDLRHEPADTETFEIAPLMRELYEAFAPIAAEKGIALTFSASERAELHADREKIRQMVAILLDNALEYTPAGGRVRLDCSALQRHIEIAVTDDGPGIPDELKERVFDRFFRADKARGRMKAHYGLGLSIARQIARQYGGEISAADATGGGAQFIIRIDV